MSQPRPLPTRVVADVRRLVESEELGEAYFGTAARLARSEEQRRCWAALRDLEIRTNRAVARFVDRAELVVASTNRAARAAGTSAGAGGLLIPDAIHLRLLKAGTRRYLPAFRRLADYYRGTDNASFFDYVVNHELAIIAYAEGALRGDRNALDPVLRLLDQPLET